MGDSTLIYDIEVTASNDSLYILDREGSFYSGLVVYNDSTCYYTDYLNGYTYAVPLQDDGFTYIRNCKYDTLEIKVSKEELNNYIIR